jgi:hypothetical protein
MCGHGSGTNHWYACRLTVSCYPNHNVGSALGALGQPTPIDPRPGLFGDVYTRELVITEKAR